MYITNNFVRNNKKNQMLDLLMNLLKHDPSERLDAKSALAHSLFSTN
jgi:serine/threonine protein kinase